MQNNITGYNKDGVLCYTGEHTFMKYCPPGNLSKYAQKELLEKLHEYEEKESNNGKRDSD